MGCYSATHLEIVNGLLEFPDAEKHVFDFSRDIVGLPQSEPSLTARLFTDYLPDGNPDLEAAALCLQMRADIKAVLSESQIHTFPSCWQGTEDSPISLDHLDQFCLDVEESLKRVISGQLDELVTKKDTLTVELEGQAAFIVETGTILFGRDRDLARIVNHAHQLIAKGKTQPLIVHGIAGNGKSALMAKAVMALTDAFKSPLKKGDSGGFAADGLSKSPPAPLCQRGEDDGKAVVLYRFIGATPRSWVSETFLEDLVRHMAREYGQPEPEMPEGGIRKIAELFKEHLALASQEKPLILLIDALDQFDSTRPILLADLFPRELPDHVCLILSILDGTGKERLVGHYPKAALLEVKPLGPKACAAILDNLLEKGDDFTPQRTITARQKKALLTHTSAIGSPLYVTLLAPTARRLRSLDNVPELPDNIEGLTEFVINDIARRHGYRTLTRTALQYLKLARFGLSEKELQKVLWADPEVQVEFDRLNKWKEHELNAMPPIIWSRLYAELDPYINEYWMDGQLLHRYFHRVFGEVAGKMYEERRRLMHGRLADYFGQQALYDGQLPNGRKLMEQARHLIQAGRLKEAEKLITDFDYCMAKCRLNRSDDLADEYRTLKSEAANMEINLSPAFGVWEDFIRSNNHIFRRGHDKWPADRIFLQLAIEHADTSPITREAERFSEEGKCDWHWLMNVRRAKAPGVNPCLAVFEGHQASINGALPLPDGHILSWGGRNIRIWEAETGRCLNVLQGHNKEIESVRILPHGRVISYAEDKSLRIWCQEGGESLLIINNISGYTLLPNNLVLTWSADTLSIWDSDRCECLHVLKGHSGTVFQSSSPSDYFRQRMAFLIPDNRIVSWSTDKTIRIWDVKSGSCLQVLKGHKSGINNVLLLSDEQLLSWSSDKTIRLWDIETGKCLKVHKLPDQDNEVQSALILPDRKVFFWTDDMDSGLRHTFIWDTVSGVSKSIFQNNDDDLHEVILLPNSKFMSISSDTNSEFKVLIWDIERGVFQAELDNAFVKTLSLHNGRILSWSSESYKLNINGIENGECLAILDGHTGGVKGARLIPSGNILSWSDDSTIRIWDQTNGKCLKVFRGHVESIRGCEVISEDHIISWSRDKTLRLWSYTGYADSTIESVSNISIEGTIVCSDQLVVSWSLSNSALNGWDITNGSALWHIDTDSDDFCGAVTLFDNQLLTWTTDSVYQVWDIDRACCIKTIDQEQVACGEVSELMSNEATRICQHTNCYGSWLWWRGQKVSGISRQGEHPVRTEWHSNEELNPVHLFADGRCIVRSETGIHVLNLYSGNKRVGFDL